MPPMSKCVVYPNLTPRRSSLLISISNTMLHLRISRPWSKVPSPFCSTKENYTNLRPLTIWQQQFESVLAYTKQFNKEAIKYPTLVIANILELIKTVYELIIHQSIRHKDLAYCRSLVGYSTRIHQEEYQCTE